MSIRRTTCYTVACDDCRITFDETHEDYIVHFDTPDDAVAYITEHGWFLDLDGGIHCPRCVDHTICDTIGHQWGFWTPCHCQGAIPVHRIYGCDLHRICTRPGCAHLETANLATLPTIDEPTIPGC
jgi:hypothetical protein